MMMEVGQRIQDIRIENEVTGAQLGACIGINGNQVSRIETGVARCSIYQLVLICQEFGCSADYLLFGKKNTGMSKEQTLHSYTLKCNRRIISAHMIVHHQLLTLSAAYLNHIFIIHTTVKLLSKYKNHLFVLEKEKGITFASLLAGSSAHTSRMPR